MRTSIKPLSIGHGDPQRRRRRLGRLSHIIEIAFFLGPVLGQELTSIFYAGRLWPVIEAGSIGLLRGL